MSYKVLSLKWRPQNFGQVKGQRPIQQTLINAIKSNSLHPALIFAGPRGTGKTSTARILSKALRCEDKSQIEPCNECSSCLAIIKGNEMDVIEIDGASHNGVDSIRDLKNSIQYMPDRGDLKVYIIDEVHMLSQSAFNALLKTLEEPPKHVVFIMATTELKKIPPTVLSRCQILHFRPIKSETIQQRLKEISEIEKIQITEEALWLITEQAQNSMRDAQVLLDQMACMENKKISEENIVHALALTPRSTINATLKAIIQKRKKEILSILPLLSTLNSEDFINQLLKQMRNLLLIKLEGDENSEFVFLMDVERKLMKELSISVSEENIHFLFDMCLKGREDLRKSFDPRIALEMVLLRMSGAPDLESLFEREIIEEESSNSHDRDSLSFGKNTQSHLKQRKKNHFTPKKTQIIKEDTLCSKEKNKFQIWEDFISFLQKKEDQLSSTLKSFSIQILEDQSITLGYSKSMLFLGNKIKNQIFQDKLKRYSEEFFGRSISYSFVIANEANFHTQKRVEKENKKEKEINKDLSHPTAQNITTLFKAQLIPQDPINPSDLGN